MLSLASPDALQEANARNVAAQNATVYAFPSIGQLALNKLVPRAAFTKALSQVYLMDRQAIRAMNPDMAQGPLQQTNHSLEVLHMARWGMAARALEKQLSVEHYEISLSNPKYHKAGGWTDSVEGPSAMPQGR